MLSTAEVLRLGPVVVPFFLAYALLTLTMCIELALRFVQYKAYSDICASRSSYPVLLFPQFPGTSFLTGNLNA